MQKYFDPTHWDHLNIWYNIVASFIFLGMLQWLGAFKKFWRWRLMRKALRRYVEALRAECTHVIVVGRRKGFELTEVFVRLDIARSDLMASEEDSRSILLRSNVYVLVGGPGAGKSTTVKSEVLSAIMRGGIFPIYLRLRDYVGFDSIEHFLASRLHIAHFTDPEQVAVEFLVTKKCLCVLDGLDEVRPSLRTRVIADVNAFYHKYFSERNKLIVTCRKEAYRDVPLDIPVVLEVRPLSDDQIRRFVGCWPLGFPQGKNAVTFWRDLASVPRVLELARSPLLLVGGLVQYTESNAGIPEERYEYLARVAKWLVQDWAAAQGHPPDEFRAVYSRILARLALVMHKEQRTELSRDNVERCFCDWLPKLGFDQMRAKDLLDAIGTRTGILVSQSREYIIFGQFGLQEYFASLDIVEDIGPSKLSKLEPLPWWREVVLLAVAQQKDPAQILEALFNNVPLVGAAAVAECPTPSIGLQTKAVSVCIAAVDRGEKEVSAALMPLLRKVRDGLEADLCVQLDARLAKGGANARIVALCLATAGTRRATATLAGHPELWDDCLREAGYLSSSFENLLLSWIKSGNDDQWKKAVDLIVVRMSSDRMEDLIELLPGLPPNRSEYIAEMLIGYSRYASENSGPLLYSVSTYIASKCVVYIRDKEAYIERRLKAFITHRELSGRLDRLRPSDVMWKNAGDIVSAALFIPVKGSGPNSFEVIYRTLWDCRIWCLRRGEKMLFVLAPVAWICGVFKKPETAVVLTFAALVSAVIACTYRHRVVPWSRRFEVIETNWIHGLTFLISGVLLGYGLVWWDDPYCALIIATTMSAAIGTSGLACHGAHFDVDSEWDVDLLSTMPIMSNRAKNVRPVLCSAIIPFVYVFSMIIVMIIQLFLYDHSRLFSTGLQTYLVGGIQVVFLGWSLTALAILKHTSAIAFTAVSDAEKTTAKILERMKIESSRIAFG